MDLLVLVPYVSLVALLLLGLPVAFSIGIAGMMGIWITTGDLNMLFSSIGVVTYNSAATYVLSTIPMFILMAFLSSSGGLVEALFKAASDWLSGIKGGLAIATVFASGIFGAMSGVSSAAASVMSKIAMPHMRRMGYSEVLSAGCVGIGATLDVLIPPSVGMVIYGVATNTSIAKLLLAGVVPGIVLGIVLIVCLLIWVRLRPGDAPVLERVSWPARWRSLGPVWPALTLTFLVMVLLYTGIATPTEVGAIGAAIAAILGVILRRLNLHSALDAFLATIRISAMIFMIIIGTFIFGQFMTLSGTPQKIMAAVTYLHLSRWTVIVAIIIVYFVLSMFMDELPLLLLTVQFTFPLIMKLGFDPIWFGVISMIMVMLGLVFPPVGMIAFVVSATGKVPLEKVYMGTSILMTSIIITLILLMVFPGIATWLPSTMK